jgi:hypothetical protein
VKHKFKPFDYILVAELPNYTEAKIGMLYRTVDDKFYLCDSNEGTDVTFITFGGGSDEVVFQSKTFEIIGDDHKTEYEFTHEFNSNAVSAKIYNSLGQTVYAEILRSSLDNIKVILGQPLNDAHDLTLIVTKEG